MCGDSIGTYALAHPGGFNSILKINQSSFTVGQIILLFSFFYKNTWSIQHPHGIHFMSNVIKWIWLGLIWLGPAWFYPSSAHTHVRIHTVPPSARRSLPLFRHLLRRSNTSPHPHAHIYNTLGEQVSGPHRPRNSLKK